MRQRLAATAALSALLATGCAATSPVADPGQSNPRAPGASPPAANPAALVGSWHLEAPGEPKGAMLTIGDRVGGAVLLFRPCGVLDADWGANRHAMLVMRSYGGDQSCFLPTDQHPHPEPTWMPRITSFRSDGAQELLLDSSGRVIARLTPGAHPKVGSNRLPGYASPPVVTEQMRASWRDPAPLPPGVRAITRAGLLGTWVPADDSRSSAYVNFRPDNSFAGSDGCNGAGGQYLIGPGGLVLTTTGGSTLIGCENNPLPSWVTMSGRCGLRAGRLVFVDRRGKVLGEAARS